MADGGWVVRWADGNTTRVQVSYNDDGVSGVYIPSGDDTTWLRIIANDNNQIYIDPQSRVA
ncbi:MAG: hypothetical protein HC779_00260 [Phyllobacteriaceae bacterium]|nr:hypothetical protein [Phyllobacteriaceae bacterium]